MAELNTTALLNDANILSYYRLQGNSTDAKGVRNGSDTSVSYVDAKYGQGASFAGAGNINTGTHVYSNAQVATGTLAFWFKRSSAPAGNEDIFNDSGWWGARITSDGKIGGTSDGTGTYIKSTANVCDDIFHHFAYYWNATTGTLYIDAVQVNSGSQNSSPTPDSTPTRQARIGSFHDATNNFTGIVDDLASFSRNLTATEIKSLFTDNNAAFLFLIM